MKVTILDSRAIASWSTNGWTAAITAGWFSSNVNCARWIGMRLRPCTCGTTTTTPNRVRREY